MMCRASFFLSERHTSRFGIDGPKREAKGSKAELMRDALVILKKKEK